MDGGDGADVEEEAEDDDDDFDDGNSGLRVFMRLSNVVAHLTVCVLLLAIMAQFMAKRKTWVKGLRSVGAAPKAARGMHCATLCDVDCNTLL